MAKNYNNYNYGNREQRRQQQRKQNSNKKLVNELNKYELIKENGKITTNIESTQQEEVLYLSFNGVDYEINDGYFSVHDILEQSAYLNNKAIAKSYMDELRAYDNILRIALMEEGYQELKKNNPRLSFNDIAEISKGISALLFNRGSAKEQDNFREGNE